MLSALAAKVANQVARYARSSAEAVVEVKSSSRAVKYNVSFEGRLAALGLK